MKFAVISDIHSNVFALEAVLADVKKHSIDFMVNLGDILYGPIAPKTTYSLLMQHEILSICGNQDRQIFEATPADIEANPTMQFILEDLGPEPIEWMRSLPSDLQVNADLYLCHGSPSDDLCYLLENVDHAYPHLRSDKEIIQRLSGHQSPLICCGHTHIPRTVWLSTGQLIVNPGSVGLQAYTDDEPLLHSMENYNPLASYSVLEKTVRGWSIQHINVAYDVHRAVAESKKRNRMDWVHFLTTGRRQ